MMKRVRKPAGESGTSFRAQKNQFASRPFAPKAVEHEAPVGESRVSFSLADIDIFQRETVQPKLGLGPVGDRYEREAGTVSSQGRFGYSALAAERRQDKLVPNRTGMPDRLKAGIESLSGIDMSDVRVHANSDRPLRLNALAYTQGNQIYLGPGQERHLPHEAWHAVQQKERRVEPIKQMKGVGVNDDGGLEAEATEMGTQAIQIPDANPVALKNPSGIKQDVVQASFEPARVIDPGNLRKINQWDTKIGAQIPAGTTILADTGNDIEEHRKFSLNRLWKPAVNVDPNMIVAGPIAANLKGYIRNKKVAFIGNTLKNIIEVRIGNILDNAERRHPNLIGHLNKPENKDFLLRIGVVYEQWNDNKSLDTFCSGYELIGAKIDRIREGADYVADSLNHWRTWLGTAPGHNVAVNIVEVTFMKSDLHERGLGVISVKFNKPVAGGNPMFGLGDIEVLLKPEDKRLEKDLLGWSATGDQSAAEQINRILETQAGVAAGALPATESISTIKMEVGDLPPIVPGAARPTTLVEKVPGTQAQHLGVNPQTSRDEAAKAAAHSGYSHLLITAKRELAKPTLEFEKVINALNTVAVKTADAPDAAGFYPAITTAIEREITSAGANRVEAAQEASSRALNIAVAGIPDQLAALEMVKKAINAIPRQVTPSFHETLLFAGIAGIDDLHKENVFWYNGIPYLIDADNVLNFNQMCKVDSGDIDQSGFGSFYNSKQAEINRKAIKTNNPDLITTILNSAGRRLFDEMLVTPARATAILRIIQNRMQGKTARVVPIITNKWANVRNDYNSRDVAGKTQIIDDNSDPNYLVRKGVAFDRTFGPGLFGTCNENVPGGNYNQAQEKLSLRHDLDISAIPFYKYEFDTGRVLHGNRDIYHGQTLSQALNFIFLKFHPADPPPF